MQQAELVNLDQPGREPLQHPPDPVVGQRTDRVELLLEAAAPYVLRDQVRGAVHFGDAMDVGDPGVIDLGQDAGTRQEPFQPLGVRRRQAGRPGTDRSVRGAPAPSPRQVLRDQDRAIEVRLAGEVCGRESVPTQLALDPVFAQEASPRREGIGGGNVGHHQLQATPNRVRGPARSTNTLTGDPEADDVSGMESAVIRESSSTSPIFCEARIH